MTVFLLETGCVHQDIRRQRRYGHIRHIDHFQGQDARLLLVDHHDPIVAGEGYGFGNLIGVEDGHYLSPGITFGVSDRISDHVACGHGQKPQLFPDLRRSPHPEGRMGFPKQNQALDITEDMEIARFALPIDFVDPVASVVAVVVAVFGAQKL